jgi:enoyl-CoA hydratase/carnithine racemase
MLKTFQRTFPRGLRAQPNVFLSRAMSSATTAPLVEVQKDAGSKTAVIRMNKLPANSLNIAFMKELTAAIVDAEKDVDVKGFILTSNSQKVFSAGLDLLELSRKDLDIGDFWNSLQELWLQHANRFS